MRKIVHIDMDAFYASVEQRDDPALRGRPVVVAWKGARSVVCAASYEARAFGVRSAMPALRAEKLCPQALFVAPDFARYKAVSQQVRAIFARHTDRIEPLSLDEAYLDVSENKLGIASATAIAQSIRAEIRAETGLTASAGVAPNKFIAKIASDWNKPDGLFVVRPEQVLDFLAPLDVGRMPGVGKVMQGKLGELGIRSIADLRAFALPALQARFGQYGRRLHELAQGIDEQPVLSERPTQQISAEDTFAEDVVLAATGPMIEALAERVWRAAERELERVARTVVLKLKTREVQSLTRSLTPGTPPADAASLARIALDLRDRVGLPASTRYRLVGVGLAGFVERTSFTIQPGLFGAD
ncbi:MAG: DNA polymerase IV [Xanthomonadales bacterium]|nr:DNA polymerase IV [Xanthomonadales bacterium]